MLTQGKISYQFPPPGAAWSEICFATLILQKNHKIVNISSITKVREKISTNFESLYFMKYLDVCFNKFINHQILLDKISNCVANCNTVVILTMKLLAG
jgi:hypothetical protein